MRKKQEQERHAKNENLQSTRGAETWLRRQSGAVSLQSPQQPAALPLQHIGADQIQQGQWVRGGIKVDQCREIWLRRRADPRLLEPIGRRHLGTIRKRHGA